MPSWSCCLGYQEELKPPVAGEAMGGSGQGENVDSASFNTRCGCSALNLRKAFEFVWRLFFFLKTDC